MITVSAWAPDASEGWRLLLGRHHDQMFTQRRSTGVGPDARTPCEAMDERRWSSYSTLAVWSGITLGIQTSPSRVAVRRPEGQDSRPPRSSSITIIRTAKSTERFLSRFASAF